MSLNFYIFNMTIDKYWNIDLCYSTTPLAFVLTCFEAINLVNYFAFVLALFPLLDIDFLIFHFIGFIFEWTKGQRKMRRGRQYMRVLELTLNVDIA